MKVIFKTKIVKDEHLNGQEVKIIKHLRNYRVLIEFSDGKRMNAYESELEYEY